MSSTRRSTGLRTGSLDRAAAATRRRRRRKSRCLRQQNPPVSHRPLLSTGCPSCVQAMPYSFVLAMSTVRPLFDQLFLTIFSVSLSRISDTQSPEDREKHSGAALMPHGMASKAAIVGIGVDMLYLPRLRQLIARHARRVQHSLPSSAAAHSAPAAATTVATSRLTRRILHDAELDELRARSASSPFSQNSLDDEATQLRYLAVR